MTVINLFMLFSPGGEFRGFMLDRRARSRQPQRKSLSVQVVRRNVCKNKGDSACDTDGCWSCPGGPEMTGQSGNPEQRESPEHQKASRLLPGLGNVVVLDLSGLEARARGGCLTVRRAKKSATSSEVAVPSGGKAVGHSLAATPITGMVSVVST